MLSHEDIISLGWKQSWNEENEVYYDKDHFILGHFGVSHVIITDKNRNRETPCGYFHHQLFEGDIRDRVELEKILHQINVA